MPEPVAATEVTKEKAASSTAVTALPKQPEAAPGALAKDVPAKSMPAQATAPVPAKSMPAQATAPVPAKSMPAQATAPVPAKTTPVVAGSAKVSAAARVTPAARGTQRPSRPASQRATAQRATAQRAAAQRATGRRAGGTGAAQLTGRRSPAAPASGPSGDNRDGKVSPQGAERLGPGASKSVSRAEGRGKAMEFSATVGEEMLATAKLAQQLVIGPLTKWAQVVGKVVPQPPALGLVPDGSQVAKALDDMFEAAQELLGSQRKFVSDLAHVLVAERKK